MTEKIVYTAASLNCGGRCLLKAHVEDGRVVKISADDTVPDDPKEPQLRSCLRCRSYREYMYHPERLLQPLKRAGKRGAGIFAPITWDEALETIAFQTERVMKTYGPEAIYLNYATGHSGRTSERAWVARLLALYGGFLSYYGTYSTACTEDATPYTFGTNRTGSSRADWVNSKLIILLGWNPAETIHGTNTAYYLKLAKEAGAEIISIDPIYSNTTAALADQWIPIRPTTDCALLEAMAYVMITENLQDQAFLDRYCIGFDEQHMPAHIPKGNSFKSYILGEGADQRQKTPEWAEAVTGIPREEIVLLARKYALQRPGALIQGYGPQRHAYGEQIVRCGTVLAAMTGNVGRKGGWASGHGKPAHDIPLASIPIANPCKTQISMFTWTEALVRGCEMGVESGVRGAAKLQSNIKLIFNLGGNCLTNQHSDVNGTEKLLEDESLAEFIVDSGHFITPSTNYADIILPADTFMEREDIVTPWLYGDYVLYGNQAVEPPGECRNGYSWVCDLAAKLGLREEFTEGRSLQGWLRYLVEETRKADPDFPTFEELKEKGSYRRAYKEPYVAFYEQIEEPKTHPFPTPSGKIEIFSERLWKKEKPETIPAIPKYISAWEGPEDLLRQKYPLQCIGHHYKRRVHSTFDNIPSMEEAGRQEVWMNHLDAEQRQIAPGQLVRVFNDRGAMVLPVKVTPRIMPGVVSVPQGAWRMLDKDGVDRRGCINVLTKYAPTPLAFGNPQHTNLVEIQPERADK